jgi:hypothetical protein
MFRQKMTQCHKELARMVTISALNRRAAVVAQHIPDPFGAMLLMQKVVAQGRGGYLGDVLMLGDGQHFLLAQAAQRDAIIQRDHDRPPMPGSFVLLALAPFPQEAPH